MKNYIEALKANKDNIRQKTAIVVGVTVLAVVAGAYLNKISKNPDVVLVLEEPMDAIIEATTEN